MLVAPEAFKFMCRAVEAPVLEFISDGNDLANAAVIGLDAAQRKTVKAFIDQLWKDGATDSELAALWWRMPSGLYFEDGAGARNFLTLVRAALDRVPIVT